MTYPSPLDVLQHWFFFTPFMTGDWNYKSPDSWLKVFPQCNGDFQSPIDFQSENVDTENLKGLSFMHYDEDLKSPVEMINHGIYAEIGVRISVNGNRPFLTVDDQTDKYEVQVIHFHWGSSGVKGSEHSIDSEKYDAEMHMVHKNSKYRTLEEARKNKDGFIVLGIFLSADDSSESHATIDSIFDGLKEITEYRSTTELVTPIAMESFMPGINRNAYFSYKGSLTTPPCSESVLWFVFSDVIKVSPSNLENFWNLRDNHGTPILNNFRTTQVQEMKRTDVETVD